MTDDGVRIDRVDEEHRYELFVGDDLAGYVEFRERPGRIVFIHTIVDPAFEGRGFGSRLARHVLDDAVARGDRIVPRCPFIAAYLKTHPGYEESVDWPEHRPEHA
ncbi:GNAT family N-acetyltransferase [Agromyces aurantiacus]|uniref:GNAT family N-acetyltransferase n=1 Tax=Agromyces aurantiacus TaxID=165814 RepID=A0ABV9R4Y2_9MICO|nr:GNAT family N-acetyltransferase [Agromyces aurantiacus]MBM7503215.1 putative GNAT family acetyltransferase [Agromyces aurantiacus]